MLLTIAFLKASCFCQLWKKGQLKSGHVEIPLQTLFPTAGLLPDALHAFKAFVCLLIKSKEIKQMKLFCKSSYKPSEENHSFGKEGAENHFSN